MPSPAQIIRFRRHRQERVSRLFGTRAGWGCSMFLSLIAALTGIIAALGYVELTRDLPSIDTLPALLDPPNGLLLVPTRLYDRTGTHLLLELRNPAAAEAQFLTQEPSQPNFLPSALISATLAVSDPAFWNHPGYSFAGIGSGDHPTLAQKLVSDLLLWDEPHGLRRALRERLLAAQVTSRFGRQRVLLWFLNSANFGRLTFGADAAARVYYGKPAARLNLAEAASLAAVLQTPALNPLDAPKVAQERAEEVIRVMLDGGWINATQADQARKAELIFRPKVDPASNPAPAFANLVLEQLGHDFDLNRLQRGGFRIMTTLDYDLQTQVNCALQMYIARIEGQAESPGLLSSNECSAARLLPTSLPQTGVLPRNLRGNVIILDQRTGQLLAMAGEATNNLDPSHYPGHPPGSLLTPFISLTGFTRGLGPASLVWDIPIDTERSLNLDGNYHGPMRLRTALDNDYLAPAEQVMSIVGADNVWQMARQLGLEGASFPAGESTNDLLQGGEATLLELTRAYGVLANLGILAGRENKSSQTSSASHSSQPVVILGMEDAAGKPWLEIDEPQTRPVITPQLAYLVTNILSDEPARWPTLGHPNPLEIGRPFSAKLGRTASGQDAWAIGSTPYFTIGVWIGQPDQIIRGQVTIRESAALLHALAQYASRNTPPLGWPVPPGINTLAVCDPSGFLPTAECPNIVNEIFLAGNEPTQTDTLYRKLQINRETGRLATVFTPPDLVEGRVYLMVPPEAQDWARQAGLPTPPDTYDVIQADTSLLSQARITSPPMFAYLHGKVEIMGSVEGKGFSSYRLQFGQGLNPQRWLQIGSDLRSPVTEGELGIWDTQGLSGLYALQLQVIYQDQHVETALVQVTVDNQPPEINIVYPNDAQEIPKSTGDIILQAQVSDDLALSDVEFYVDDVQISTLTQAPFAVAWQPRSGAHTLRVKAADQAGNSNEKVINFSIQ
jgi:membrane peptidoglycan carboxypeptidase